MNGLTGKKGRDYTNLAVLLHSAAMKTLRLIPLLLLVTSPGAAQDSHEELAKIKERELEQVREQISVLKRSMDRSAAERDRLTGELQAAEVDIAEKRIHIAELERQQRFSDNRKQQLEADLEKRQAELDEESGQLAAQLRSAYMSGNQERIRMLLNQQDPATLGRVMAYYRYLNDYRTGNIEAVVEHIRRLDELYSQIAAEVARLERLAKDKYEELSELDAVQERRRELLASLRQRIASEGKEVERLAAQEKDLSRLITELTSILSDYPISSEQPFSDHKGGLTWPVAGTLLHDFGQPRAGSAIKWNGVVLGAPRGREVRSVYHGRVVFADWLAGMGLLVIVDHGDGYMTLYGYNETILKNAGDWVAPGDVLATVGDSGGRPETGLYFEVRMDTRPVNPRQWFTRRPGS